MNSLIFFGSDQYSEVVLNNLLSSPVALIVTDRPKPKGRDQITEPNPVEKLAIKHHLKVAYYPNNSDEMNNFISDLASIINHQSSIIGLCASFDHLLPPIIISLFKGNLFNLHPSILPQYRNVSPVQYAVALGDKITGITLFKISSGIDNGEIVAQLQESILPSDTTPTLTSRLFSLGTNLFLKSLQGSVPCKKNKVPYLVKPITPSYRSKARESEELIFTKRLTRDSGFVEWPNLHRLLQNQPISASDTKNELLHLRLSHTPTIDHQPSIILHALVRALTPWPSVWSTLKTKKGELRVTMSLPKIINNKYKLQILISGKPSPITLSDFTKYYLKP